MVETYTPPALPSFLVYPFTIVDNGEGADKEAWNKTTRPIVDHIEKLKIDLTEDIGVMAALQTKTGLPVVDSSDTALPTYASGNVLSGAASHQTALESLDTDLATKDTKFANIDANVGGLVTAAGSPVYASGKVNISDGDSHHTAIEKLDDAVAVNATLSTTASADAATALAGTTNVADKLGAGAELAPAFDWTYELLITDGDKIKDIIDDFDRYIWANQRLADQVFGRHVSEISDDLVADFDFYDTFIDATKVDGSTTSTIDTFLYEATGGATEVIYVRTLPAAHSQVALVWDYDLTGGAVTFEANMIGSVLPGDFSTISTEKTFVVPASGAGTTLVVKVSLVGASSKLFNIGMFTKV